MSREQQLHQEPQPAMAQFLQQFNEAKEIYQAFTQAKDIEYLMRNVREQMRDNLAMSLEAAFPDVTPSMSLDVLTQYIVGQNYL